MTVRSTLPPASYIRRTYLQIKNEETPLIKGGNYYIIYDDTEVKHIKINRITEGNIYYTYVGDADQGDHDTYANEWDNIFDTFSTTEKKKRRESRQSRRKGGTKRRRNKKSRKRI